MPPISEAIAVEARAKIMWGECDANVLAYLRSMKISEDEAVALLREINAERLASIRRDGLKKVWLGVFLVSLPIATYWFARSHGGPGSKGFAATLVLGAIGLMNLTNGLWMLLRPKATTGDLSNIKDFTV